MILIPIILVIIIVFLFYKRTVPQLEGWRKYTLISLRAITFIILLFLLFNPILNFSKTRQSAERVLILKDVSESMELENEGVSKTELIRDFQTEIVRIAEQQNYEREIIEFANGIAGEVNSTRLTKTLDELSENDRLKNVQAIYLLSDGWLKDDDLQIIDKLNIPIYTIDPQYELKRADLLITDVHYNKTGYKNELTPIRVFVQASNYDGKARINLLQNDKQIRSSSIDFSKNPNQTIDLDNRFAVSGLNRFELRVEADTLQEGNLDNNKFQGAIQIKEQKTNILFISETLNWDLKFMIDAVQKNPRWQHTFLMKRDQFYKADDPVKLAKELTNSSVVVIINNGELSLDRDQIELLANYLNRDGGMICWGKPVKGLDNFLPSEDLEIAKTFRSTFRLTEISKQFGSFSHMQQDNIEEIPPVQYFYVNAKIQSKVLAVFNNEENSPAILLSATGNILQFTFLDLWKWQLWAEGGNYEQFILDILSWIGQKAGDRFVSYSDKNAYYAGESVETILQAFDEKLAPIRDLNAKLTLYNSADEVVLEKFMLGRADEYYLEMTGLEPDGYHYEIESARLQLSSQGEFIVYPENPERSDLGFNTPLLSYISAQTNGELLESNSLDTHKLPEAEISEVKINNELPIYKKWYFVALFVICFCSELFLRKRWGLL